MLAKPLGQGAGVRGQAVLVILGLTCRDFKLGCLPQRNISRREPMARPCLMVLGYHNDQTDSCEYLLCIDLILKSHILLSRRIVGCFKTKSGRKRTLCAVFQLLIGLELLPEQKVQQFLLLWVECRSIALQKKVPGGHPATSKTSHSYLPFG